LKQAWLVVLGLVVIGCGDKSGGGASSAKPSLPANAVADANAAIPKDQAGKVEFVEGKYEHNSEEALAVLPKGWKASGAIPGRFAPPEGSKLGFMTSFSVGTNCDGMCSAKDWAATADKVEFAQFSKDGYKVDKDEKGNGSRVLVATSKEGKVHVAAAFWKDGERRYFSCRADLEKDDAALAPAFEKACRAVTPVSW